jgi:hypothetical protein
MEFIPCPLCLTAKVVWESLEGEAIAVDEADVDVGGRESLLILQRICNDAARSVLLCHRERFRKINASKRSLLMEVASCN